MDLGSAYINKSKHSNDLEIASLHKALHDLQSYIHLILRIIGGLAGFTSDHLSSELINELSKISPDSTVQVLFPYKTSTARSVPNVEYPSQFNSGANASPWSDVQYSTFFSNLAKSLPTSSATDFRENHQLGLNRVLKPSPRKPQLSMFTSYSPRQRHTHSPDAKMSRKCVETSPRVNLNVHRSERDELYASSENDADHEPSLPRNAGFADLTDTTRPAHTLNSAYERERGVHSKAYSRPVRTQMNSLSTESPGYSHPSSASSIDGGRFVLSTVDRARKKLSNDLVICKSRQTKFPLSSKGSLNVSDDQHLPKTEPIALLSNPCFDSKLVGEVVQSSNIVKNVNEAVPKDSLQVRLFERKVDSSVISDASQESLINRSPKISYNDPELSKIALVDLKLLKNDAIHNKSNDTCFKGMYIEVDEKNHVICSKKALTREFDNFCPPNSPANVRDSPLLVNTSKVNDNVGENEVDELGTQNSLSSASYDFLSTKNVNEQLYSSPCNKEQTKFIFVEQQVGKGNNDNEPSRCLIVPADHSSLANDNLLVQPSNIASQSVRPTVVSNREGNEVVNEFKVKSASDENSGELSPNTDPKSLTCVIDHNDHCFTKNVVEGSKSSDTSDNSNPKSEIDSRRKLMVEIPTIKLSTDGNDHGACQIESKALNNEGALDDSKSHLNKFNKLDKLFRAQKTLGTKTCNDVPSKLDLSSDNPTVARECTKEKLKKCKSSIGDDLGQVLNSGPSNNLKLPDMPDLIADSDESCVQNSSSHTKEKMERSTNSIKRNSPDSDADTLSVVASTESISLNNSFGKFNADDLSDCETDHEASKKIQCVDTSDTNELSDDDDSEGKLVIDISDAEPRPSADSMPSKRKFSHPKKNWRIKMLQDNDQVDGNTTKKDALKVSRLSPCQDLLLDSFTKFSAGSFEKLADKDEITQSLVETSNEQSSSTRCSQEKQVIGLTIEPGGKVDDFKKNSPIISPSNDTTVLINTNSSEALNDKLKHLPIEIQRGLRRRNEILMKYFRTFYPNTQAEGKLLADSFDSRSEPDSTLDAMKRSFKNPSYENPFREEDEETKPNSNLDLKYKQIVPCGGTLYFSDSHSGSRTSKAANSYSHSTEFGVKSVTEKNLEEGTSDSHSQNSFLSYILHGYSMSSEEGSSQSATDPRKGNDACPSPRESIGRRSLSMVAGKIFKEQDYAPKQKRRKTDPDMYFDYDHRRRREKNNEASKRHRESKKKLQKEAFDSITKLEEVNLRLRQKAEKLDSAVKQVLKVITTLSANS